MRHLKMAFPQKIRSSGLFITRLNPEAFRDCFLTWVNDYEQELGRTIAIDGKTLRRSFDKAGERCTTDTMGRQKKISEKIMGSDEDYIIAPKGNQNTLYKAVSKFFNNPFDMSHCKLVDVPETKESNRSRIEKRKCLVTEALDELNLNKQWPGMKNCLSIESKHTRNGKKSTGNRFYI